MFATIHNKKMVNIFLENPIISFFIVTRNVKNVSEMFRVSYSELKN